MSTATEKMAEIAAVLALDALRRIQGGPIADVSPERTMKIIAETVLAAMHDVAAAIVKDDDSAHHCPCCGGVVVMTPSSSDSGRCRVLAARGTFEVEISGTTSVVGLRTHGPHDPLSRTPVKPDASGRALPCAPNDPACIGTVATEDLCAAFLAADPIAQAWVASHVAKDPK